MLDEFIRRRDVSTLGYLESLHWMVGFKTWFQQFQQIGRDSGWIWPLGHRAFGSPDPYPSMVRIAAWGLLTTQILTLTPRTWTQWVRWPRWNLQGSSCFLHQENNASCQWTGWGWQQILVRKWQLVSVHTYVPWTVFTSNFWNLPLAVVVYDIDE